jgi:hypothetical protein
LLVWLATTIGIRGIAIAWFIRMVVDGIALWWILYQRFESARPVVWRIGQLAAACLVAVGLAAVWGAHAW